DSIIAKKPSPLNIKNIEDTRAKLSAAQAETVNLADAPKEKKEYAIQSGERLKTLRITAAPANEDTVKKGPLPSIRALRAEADHAEVEFEPALMLSPANARPMRRTASFRALHVMGVMLTAVWAGLCVGYIQTVM